LLALLARDVADIPPRFLDFAIRRWVGSSPFMPKASDLIALAQSAITPPKADGMSLAQRYNMKNTRTDVVWRDSPEGGVYLEYLR
jgi:hypothetical protein